MSLSHNVFALSLVCVSTVASAETFEADYKPPSAGVTLRFSAPQRTRTPLLAEVCVDGKWKVAAVLGEGLYRTGRLIVVENEKIAANPKAVRLPSSADVLVSSDADVAIRVRSHAELVSGGPMSTSYALSSCSAPVSFSPKPGNTYEALWAMTPQACGLTLRRREVAAQSTELDSFDEPSAPGTCEKKK